MPSQNSAVLSGWELSKTVEGSRSATWPLLTTKFQLVSRYMTLGWSERTFVALGPCVISYVKVPFTVPSGPKVPVKCSVRRFASTSMVTESLGPPSSESDTMYRPVTSGVKVGVSS